MAPTVCMAEVGERLGYLDTTLNLNYLISEKRRSLQSRKRLHRHLKPCHKLQMGLIMEECHQPPSCEPPTLDCERDSASSDSNQFPRLDRDSLVTITLRTLALLRRNQQLQQRLSLLQQETRAFVTTVLASPDYVPPVTANN